MPDIVHVCRFYALSVGNVFSFLSCCLENPSLQLTAHNNFCGTLCALSPTIAFDLSELLRVCHPFERFTFSTAPCFPFLGCLFTSDSIWKGRHPLLSSNLKITSEQATVDTSVRTSEQVATTTPDKGGNMNKNPAGVDDDSIETQVRNTSSQVVGTFQNLFAVQSHQTTADSKAETAKSSEPGVPVPTEEKEGAIITQKAINDDSFATQLENTRAQVVGTFEKLFDPNSVQAAVSNMGAYLNPSREKGGKMRDLPPNEDDSFETQIKHTQAQVVGTFKNVSTSLQQAGEKIKGALSGTTDEIPPKNE